MAAAVAGIGVSTAALYPSITLGAGFGTFATAFRPHYRGAQLRLERRPADHLEFPHLSIAEAEVEQANATARGTLASFNGTVLTALREPKPPCPTSPRRWTPNSSSRRRAMTRRWPTNTSKLYGSGVSEFLDVLDAQATEINAEAALAQQTAKLAQDQVTLFIALGSGWQTRQPSSGCRCGTSSVKHLGALLSIYC